MTDKPNKIFVTYELDQDGNEVYKEIVMYSESGFVREDFDPDKHLDIIGAFLGENGMDIAEAQEKGIFAQFDADAVTREDLEGFLGVELAAEEEAEVEPPVEEVVETTEEEPVVEPQPTEEEDYAEAEDLTRGKADRKVIVGGIALAATALTLLGLHSCSQQQIDEQKEETSEDLYKNMTEEQKAFFEPAFQAVEAFNARTTEEGNFKLGEDETELHITASEAVALSVIMNDYTPEELYNIFGTYELDNNNIMSLARSAYSKLSTYYMNAKQPSGLSQIIRDEDAREFFERHENAVIAFNNNPSTELSDKVIKGLYYDYVCQGSTGNYANIQNSGVAWFATSAEFGFELANRNMPEYLKINNVSEEEATQYGDAVAEVGMPLSKVTKGELLSGINEEVNLDIMDEINQKSLCAAVTTQTKDRVDGLRTTQQVYTAAIKMNAKDNLVEGLKNIGAHSLANKVSTAGTLTEELLDEVRNHNASANKLADTYSETMDSITKKEAGVVAAMELAQERYGKNTEIDLADLVNNRFRTKQVTKEPDTKPKDKTNSTTISREEFDDLDKKEKDDYIKQNGTVIKTETTTTQVEVKEEELTEEEKKEVVSEKAVLEAIEELSNLLRTQGAREANAYTEEIGAYDYNNRIVNPYNNEVINTDNLSLFNIVAHVSAFGENAEKINSNDSQIQNRMNADSEDDFASLNKLSADEQAHLKKLYGDDWKQEFFEATYEDAYEGQIDGSLNIARDLGGELAKSAKEAYEQAQAALKATAPSTTTPSTTTPSTTAPSTTTPSTTTPSTTAPSTTVPSTTTPEVDPNLGEQFGEEEIPYVPSSPVEYVGDGEVVLTTDDYAAAFAGYSYEPANPPKTMR